MNYQLTIALTHARVLAIEILCKSSTEEAQLPMNADLSPMQEWLQSYVKDCSAVAGTVHLRQGDGLALAAAVNIPPPVQEIVRWVPRGKGMAGMALDTGKPVQTCNLKEDDSGRVKPGAKAVAARAAIALPLKDADNNVIAVLGVAFQEEREIGQPEIDQLLRSAQSIPVSLSAGA
jgi:L-methionine (R)-S-oxide reductase